jgi:hypothetical protein
MYDVIILGAGASGLMAASLLKTKNVLLLDANSRIGRKLKISGGGKCNVTNETVSAGNYLGDPDFVAPVLARFDQKAVLDYFATRGVRPKIRSRGQYFCTDSSEEILEVFAKATTKAVKKMGCIVTGVDKLPDGFEVATSCGSFRGKNLLVATGGLSYPGIGASGIGMDIAEKFGHAVVLPRPALVGFTVQKEQFWFKALSGISFKVGVTVGTKRFEDELLFAHKGISGPVVLNASLYWEKGKMTFDFIPGVSLEQVLKKSPKNISTALPLPKRFVKEFLKSVGVADKPVAALSAPEREKIGRLKAYDFSPAGNFGYTKAEATKGGVATNEIDPNTMQSRLVPGVYFAGEVLDVTGELGGYNFQWAFASAVVCAEAMAG